MKQKLGLLLLLCSLLLLTACVAPVQPGEPETPDTPEVTDPVVPDEEKDPIELSMEQDFSPVVGDWLDENGSILLTVYPNGGFALDDSTGHTDGYLVYTEEDGGMWDAGPRYAMYLENNERFDGAAHLSLEGVDPGTLAFCRGGGAEVLVRMEGQDFGEIYYPVEVYWDDEVPGGLKEYDVCTANQGAISRVVLVANSEVKDLKVNAIAFRDVLDDSTLIFDETEVYSQERLTPERPLVVEMTFIGDIPNIGFTFTDEYGDTQRLALGISGMDGALYLTPYETPVGSYSR